MDGIAETLHASCVAIGDRAVLIEGPSGSGKSDLALRLIDRGAVLVSDDYTDVRTAEGHVMARAPATIAGSIEVRGLGIHAFPARDEVQVALVVRLDALVPRMPEQHEFRSVAGQPVPVIALDAFHASTPIKVELALSRLGASG
jgi:serine kinase of HPr protein (carbohydrate metabolism regulator)